MNIFDLIQIILYLVVLLALSPFLGIFMANVFQNKKTFLDLVISPIENFIYKISFVNKDQGMDWKEYTFSLLMFNLFGFIILYLILFFQNFLPFNPQGFKGVSWHLAFNTAASFVTNTNWQAYSGESTLGYFSQMAGLAVQNFVSAATGIAVLVALIRGIINKSGKNIGNFWVDLTKSILYVLLPLSIIVALLLVSQGVIQNFSGYITINTLEGGTQVIPTGPTASQIAIKQLGTNGGGFFGINSSHPFENATPISNFIEMFSILIIPFACVFMFGKMVNSKSQGIAVFLTMFILFLSGLVIQLYFEYQLNPLTGIAGSMEGKEVRFGITNSIIWAQATTSASNGSVNSMHDSLSPIAGLITMLNLMIGEVIFGGVGAGLYGMLIYIFLTVFIAGLMVGRTPEYFGKKIEKREIQMTILAIIAPAFCILVFSAISAIIKPGLAYLNNQGPHGLSEILYAFSSGAGNNGSAFAGLGVDNPYYNILLGITMIIGRFGVIIPALVIAGSLSVKKYYAESPGTFKTDSPIFVILLISVILIISVLTFFPALVLGPVAEHFLMLNGISF